MSGILQYISAHKFQTLTTFIVLALVGVGVYLALNQTVLRSRAGGGTKAEFRLDSAVTAARPGDTVRVLSKLTLNGNKVVALNSLIEYDPRVFDVTDVDIVPGTLFTVAGKTYGLFPVKKVENGKILFDWAAFNPTTGGPVPSLLSIQGQVPELVLATITLKVKQSPVNGNTTIRFGPPTDNKIGAAGASGNMGQISPTENKIDIAISGGVAGPSCTLAMDKDTIGLTSSSTFTLTTSGLPAGATAVFKGKNNGTAIAEAAVPGFSITSTPPLSFTGTQFGGVGTYERSVVIRSGSTDICTTPTKIVTVTNATLPPTIGCILSVDKATGGVNDTFNFTLTSPLAVDSVLPSGSELTWSGTNNGTAIASSSGGVFTGTPQVVGSFTGAQFGGAGTYTRSIKATKNGAQLCQTVPVSITVQAQGGGSGVPPVSTRTISNPAPLTADLTQLNKVCQATGGGSSCSLSTISYIEGWDTPSQNDSFITAGGDYWIFGAIAKGVRSEQTGKVKDAFPQTCGSDNNCTLDSVAQFKAYDSASQNDVLVVKGNQYWIYKPVNSNQRPVPTSGSVLDIDGVTQACSGLTNCQVESVSQYRQFDTPTQNQSFVIVSGLENGSKALKYAVVNGLYQNGQVQSSRGQIATGNLFDVPGFREACSSSLDCDVKAMQYLGYDSSTQNNDLIVGNNLSTNTSNFVVRDGLNKSVNISRPTPIASAAPVKYTIQDAQAMIAAWGSITAGNRATNGKWDLNNDNVVNIKDWAILYESATATRTQ